MEAETLDITYIYIYIYIYFVFLIGFHLGYFKKNGFLIFYNSLGKLVHIFVAKFLKNIFGHFLSFFDYISYV